MHVLRSWATATRCSSHQSPMQPRRFGQRSTTHTCRGMSTLMSTCSSLTPSCATLAASTVRESPHPKTQAFAVGNLSDSFIHPPPIGRYAGDGAGRSHSNGSNPCDLLRCGLSLHVGTHCRISFGPSQSLCCLWSCTLTNTRVAPEVGRVPFLMYHFFAGCIPRCDQEESVRACERTPC
jgi:hypothetical protein